MKEYRISIEKSMLLNVNRSIEQLDMFDSIENVFLLFLTIRQIIYVVDNRQLFVRSSKSFENVDHDHHGDVFDGYVFDDDDKHDRELKD